jgi:hypothetical protein
MISVIALRGTMPVTPAPRSPTERIDIASR